MTKCLRRFGSYTDKQGATCKIDFDDIKPEIQQKIYDELGINREMVQSATLTIDITWCKGGGMDGSHLRD